MKKCNDKKTICSRDIPLTEYDPSPHAVIEPGHERLGFRLPEKAIFAFVGDKIDEFAAAHGMTKAAEFESITKKYPIYVSRDGSFALCEAPVGAPAATQILDWLISYGVKSVISTGSCGVLEDIPENSFLIPTEALRDEGTSYHYLPPSRFVETDAKLRRTVEAVFAEKGLPYIECRTWTTDGFFRETEEKVRARREEDGCACVEMECAALASCAKFRGTRFAMILFTADSLAYADEYAERGWGKEALAAAIELCREVIERI